MFLALQLGQFELPTSFSLRRAPFPSLHCGIQQGKDRKGHKRQLLKFDNRVQPCVATVTYHQLDVEETFLENAVKTPVTL